MAGNYQTSTHIDNPVEVSIGGVGIDWGAERKYSATGPPKSDIARPESRVEGEQPRRLAWQAKVQYIGLAVPAYGRPGRAGEVVDSTPGAGHRYMAHQQTNPAVRHGSAPTNMPYSIAYPDMAELSPEAHPQPSPQVVAPMQADRGQHGALRFPWARQYIADDAPC